MKNLATSETEPILFVTIESNHLPSTDAANQGFGTNLNIITFAINVLQPGLGSKLWNIDADIPAMPIAAFEAF